ncbi:unnamed protein product [Porites lobata]|uniref:DDE Tnp4 domain-containing protein n=1 Tax=Porites lobata TaxID=104759 RepID=A0ABN8NTG9_9CNID|nr:unnamed protein product [Porites lobata]
MNAETQTPESGVKTTQNTETQTTEFEYIFKQAVLQPFTEEYFADHDDRVRFYTGLPGFDVLKATFSFISPFVTGRSKSAHRNYTPRVYFSDKCGLLNHLKPGDPVMADRGFTIQESVALYQAQLAIPAFTRGKNQLDPLDGKRTRGIANVRIHVERVIGLLRQKYSILQGILPMDYLTCSEKSGKIPLIDRMIRVCAALTNLSASVVPFE